jgi:hypothetical protein
LVIVVDSISFQLPITQLPISAVGVRLDVALANAFAFKTKKFLGSKNILFISE